MCGIWASIGFNVTREGIDSVSHRGPDSSGWREFKTIFGTLFLGNRRLSIVDISDKGTQPMKLHGRDIWIVFNGEVYNHVELRNKLINAGYEFESLTDTEVVLAAYAHWGKACLEKFNGMFGFVIYDSEQEIIFAARDRFGIKPLYFLSANGGLAFASELKQFQAIPGFGFRLEACAALQFLLFGISDHLNETMIKGVFQLLGGECCTVDLKSGLQGAIPEIFSWYSRQKSSSPIQTDIAGAIEKTRQVMSDAVKYRLRSDVEVGACLSGGIDSSSLVGLACTNNQNIKTFTACYNDPEIDERQYAKSVSDMYGVQGNMVFPDPDDLAVEMDKLHYFQDWPTVSISVFSQWKVFEAASKKGLKVIIDGQGADEQLGGYRDAMPAFYAGLLRSARFAELWHEISSNPPGRPILKSLISGLLAGSPMSAQRAYRAIRGDINPKWLQRDFTNSCEIQLPQRISLTALNDALFEKWTLPALLRYEDRNSMAHSVEARVPFLDHHVVEHFYRLPENLKIKDGVTKWVLRQAMADILPIKVLHRHDKIGFATPQARWINDNITETVTENISYGATALQSIFEPEILSKIIKQVRNGSCDDRVAWRIASFCCWARIFKVSV